MNLQTFLAAGALKAAADLRAALLNLPEDNQNWSAGGSARTAMDMAAEVALLGCDTAQMIETKTGLASFDKEAFKRRQALLLTNWNALKKLIDENTARVAEAIRQESDDDSSVEFQMPWGAMTMTQVIEYPYWNAKYHEGQINFISSLLGCLK